ncbi:WG repeat-containing protein [Pseudoflavitalea sp. G-6-1-2]|uniref:WG repeat-containing protein n=1 Tax=Pseudoflavitalea sp. G-6-1-2 TaxID=2728841 RepID=UPI00146F14DF|nr:WG repeat-containing protein [Pseudoflavitalea sp. G-6-1-2]NML21343.1 WG repeat-containing protein [Pseudoflavitalea sp. G-6-1-2]
MKTTLIFLLILSCSVQLTAQENELIPYRVKDKYGYSDISGKIKIEPRFNSAFLFYDDYSVVNYVEGGGYALIDKSGQEILPPSYKRISVLVDRPDAKQPPRSATAIVVTNDNYYGLYALPSGKELLPPAKYRLIQYLTNSLFTVFIRMGELGVFDAATGNLLAEPIYNSASFENNEVLVSGNDKQLIIPMLPSGVPGTPKEKINVPAEKKESEEYVENVKIGSDDDDNDKYVYSQEAYDARLYKQNGKYGFHFGKEFKGDEIPPVYDEIDRYGEAEGRLVVKKDHKWGIINSKNQTLLPCLYESVFYEGCQILEKRYVVKIDGKMAVVDSSGKVLIAGYDFIRGGNGDFFVLKQDELYGLFFINGRKKNVVIKPEFRSLEKVRIPMPGEKNKHRYLVVVFSAKNNKSGLISSEGKRYFED